MERKGNFVLFACSNFKTGHCLKTMQGHTGWVWSLQGVGYQVWSGSGDKTIRIWASEDVSQPRPNNTLSAVSPNISRTERSPIRPTSPMPSVTFSSPPVSPIPGKSQSTVPTASTPAANNPNGNLQFQPLLTFNRIA